MCDKLKASDLFPVVEMTLLDIWNCFPQSEQKKLLQSISTDTAAISHATP